MTEPPAPAALTAATTAARRSFIDLRADSRSAAVGRRFVRDVICEHVCEADHAHTLVLLASELVTNARNACAGLVLDGPFHAWRARDRPVRLALTVTHRHVYLGVTGPDPRLMPRSRPAGELAETGRGLAIVAALAADVWVTCTRFGKTVHALVAAPGVTFTPAGLERPRDDL